jgi:uncharacterized protein (DUF169 family)
MTEVGKLIGQIGGWWTGVKFHFGEAPAADRKMEPVRFCEAIATARTRTVTLVPELVNCPGARRSLGWAENGDDRLVADMAAKNGLAPEVAADLVFDTPRLRSKPIAVTLGELQDPDVVISFIQAEAAMRLARRWEGRKGQALSAALPSTMAVCGNVAVQAYLTERLGLSFGCPDSRRHGAMGRDQLVVGLPMSLARSLA